MSSNLIVLQYWRRRYLIRCTVININYKTYHAKLYIKLMCRKRFKICDNDINSIANMCVTSYVTILSVLGVNVFFQMEGSGPLSWMSIFSTAIVKLC